MTNILEFPSSHDRIFRMVQPIIKERAIVYHYDPELTGMVEEAVKRFIEKHGLWLSFDIQLSLSKCCEDDIKEIEKAMHAVWEKGLEKIQELASEILKLEIEKCETLYEAQKRKRDFRLLKSDDYEPMRDREPEGKHE